MNRSVNQRAALGQTAVPSPGEPGELASVIETALAAGYVRVAETVLAGLALWAVEAVRAGQLAPAEADQLFTTLDVALTEQRGRLPALAEEAQELLVELEHLHDLGASFAPDLTAVRERASRLLQQAEQALVGAAER